MDAAEFVVSMIDQVSGPAHKASKAMDDLNRHFKKTGTIGMKFTGEGPVPDVVKRLNRQRLGTFAKAKIFKPLGEAAASGVDNALASMTRFAKYGAIALGAAGVAAAGFAVKSTVHMAMFAEKTRLAFGLLTGDKALGEKVFTRSVELSKELGMDVEETAHSMQKLLAMQFSPPDAEKWVKLGSDLRAVGVEGSALSRVMLDIAHVKATGKLSQRNVNMFANAGVSAQLLMEEVGKAMGTDEAGAVKAMHAGKITSAIALPALERAIMRKTHESAAGQSGKAFAGNTLTGLVGQLQNAPNLFFLRMADAAQGAIGKLKPLVESIKHAIDSISGDTFVKFIETALGLATKLVPLALELAKGFGEGFDTIVGAMAEIDPAKASMETAKELGHAIADAFGLALKALKGVADTLIWLDQHRDIATSLAVLMGVTRVAGAANVAKGAWGIGKFLVRGGQLASGAGMAAGAGAAAEAAAAGTAATAAAGTGAAAAAGGTVLAAGGAATAAGASFGMMFAGGLVAAIAGYGITTAILNIFKDATTNTNIAEDFGRWVYDKFHGTGVERAGDVRGVSSGDMAMQNAFGSTATPTLTGLQKQATAPRSTTNNFQVPMTINIDGTGKDGAQLGKDVAAHANEGIQQFWQSQALEAGATF